MDTQCEAIIDAFKDLGGVRTKQEIENWVNNTYGAKWKDFGTSLADMVPQSKGGNESSLVPDYFRVLERVERGKYRLVEIN